MPSLIISSASRSSPRIFIYHSSHIILIPSSFHSIILAFFTFPLIHFTMVLFAISSKLIFAHFIYHTLLFIIPSSFPSYFTSITLITTHICFSFPFASMFSIHSFASIPISFYSISSLPFNSKSSFDFTFSYFQWLPALHYPSLTLISSIPITIPITISVFSILYILFISFLLRIFVSYLWVLYHVCSDTPYRIVIWCVDRKHSLSIRRNRFCVW